MEQELIQIRRQVAEAETRAASERAAADSLVAEMRSAGADLTAADNFERVDESYKRADAARDEVNTLRTRMGRVVEILGEKATSSADSGQRREAEATLRGAAASYGERLFRSPVMTHLRESGALSMAQTRVQTDPVEVTSRAELLAGLRQRALVDNTALSGGGLIDSDRTGLVVSVPIRPVRLLDLITVGETDSDTVEWAEETTHTDAAAETAYNVLAPEAAYGWSKQTTTVRRIPHFIPATKGALADGGQLRTLLDARLMNGVRLRVESQVVVGDGVGENLRGVYNTTNVGTVTRNTAGGEIRYDAVHRAITNVRTTAFVEPNAIGITPADFEAITLDKAADNRYFHGNGDREPMTIWGLTPVVSPIFRAAEPIVGDFSAIVLAVRAGVSVAASDSHADFFLKGLVALLAEMRAAMYIPQPRAFCRVLTF